MEANGVEPEPKKRRGVEVIAYDAVANPTEFTRLIRAALSANLEVPIAATYPLEKERGC